MSQNTLMLVEDPRETIGVMCRFLDRTVTWIDFKKTYERAVGREDMPVSKGTVDTHFYTLTQLGLLVSSQEKNTHYVVSSTGKRLCNYLMSSKIAEYKKALRNILLNNEQKNQLFDAFITKVKEKGNPHKRDLSSDFRSVTLRALISWSTEAGLIEYDKDEDRIWCINSETKKELPLNEFYSKLVRIYREVEKTDIFLVRRIFADISEVRSNFCMEESMRLDDFDDNLRKLLESPYGKNIRLYGAPSSVFEGKRNFFYRGKNYVYLRIKV